MTRKRPVALLVFGIFNLLIGTVSLLGSSCCGVGAGFFHFGMREVNKDLQGEIKKGGRDLTEEERANMELAQEFFTLITNHVPGASTFLVATFAGAIALAFLQVLSGIGMVIISGWGRWLCIFWAFLGLIGAAAWLFYWFTVVTPSVASGAGDFERVMKKFVDNQEKFKKVPPRNQDLNMKDAVHEMSAGMTVVNLAFLGLYSAYAGLALLFMILPGTGEGIARYRGTSSYDPQGGSGDLYDDDNMRRRRDSGQPPDGTRPPGM